jgi:putative transposase
MSFSRTDRFWAKVFSLQQSSKMSTGVYSRISGHHNRQSIRLDEYDYSRPGYYFVTVCADDRETNPFGEVVDGAMILNEIGTIVRNEWVKTGMLRSNVKIDEFVVMPDHIHGIIRILGKPACRGTSRRALSEQGMDVNRAQPQNGSAMEMDRSQCAQSEFGSTIQKGTSRRAPTEPGNTEPGNAVMLRCTPVQPQPYEQFGRSTPDSIPTMVRLFKSAAAKRINILRGTTGKSVWQRGYYEHIVRPGKELLIIRKYIEANPAHWQIDRDDSWR